MICQVHRPGLTEEVAQVVAPNGEPSLLYQQILHTLPDTYRPDRYSQSLQESGKLKSFDELTSEQKEYAVGQWNKVYTPKFREQFGDWLQAWHDWKDGFFSSLQEAFGHYQVTLEVDPNGEPKKRYLDNYNTSNREATATPYLVKQTTTFNEGQTTICD